MAEDAHDRLEAGAAFGELGADGVPEAVAADRRAADGVDEVGLGAGARERRLEEVGGREQLAVTHEQVARVVAGQLVGERALTASGAQRDDLAQRFGGLVVERHDALAVGLAGGEAQPWCGVGVAVEGVDGEAPDLALAGAAPARDEQRGALLRAFERGDRGHESLELVRGDEPRHPARRLGAVADAEQWVAGDVGPLPRRGVAEEHRQRGGAPDPRERA